jgi:hypothetical protein
MVAEISGQNKLDWAAICEVAASPGVGAAKRVRRLGASGKYCLSLMRGRDRPADTLITGVFPDYWGRARALMVCPGASARSICAKLSETGRTYRPNDLIYEQLNH